MSYFEPIPFRLPSILWHWVQPPGAVEPGLARRLAFPATWRPRRDHCIPSPLWVAAFTIRAWM